MTSKPVSELMIDLGVCRSHSRPRTSNDNPYSEAQFKTLKYVPDFPDRFGSLADARAFCDRFFTAYNHEHRHSGIGMHTPGPRQSRGPAGVTCGDGGDTPRNVGLQSGHDPQVDHEGS